MKILTLLLKYKNTTDFYILYSVLILYSDTLLKVFIRFNSFLVKYLGSSRTCLEIKVILFFIFLFVSHPPFFFFTLNITLNESSKNGNFCLNDFQGNVFYFPTLSIMLALGLSYTAFIMLKYNTICFFQRLS